MKSFEVSEKSVEIWGSGKSKHEFIWSEGFTDTCVYIMKSVDFTNTYVERGKEIRNTHINIGTGKDISIKELSEIMKQVIGFKGDLIFNTEKSDGTVQKLTGVSKLDQLDWKYTIELEEGVRRFF